MARKVSGVRIDEDLREKYDRMAKASGTTTSALMRKALEHYVHPESQSEQYVLATSKINEALATLTSTASLLKKIK